METPRHTQPILATVTDQIWSSFRSLLRMAGGTSKDSCLFNCSGRGECQEGICLCQVFFSYLLSNKYLSCFEYDPYFYVLVR